MIQFFFFFFKIIIGLFIFKVLLCKYGEEDEIDHEDDGGPVYYDNDEQLMMNFPSEMKNFISETNL